MATTLSGVRGRLVALSPTQIGLLGFVAALLFVGVRFAVAADRDISRFVVAGTVNTNPATVQPKIYVFESTGYDGQFFWRIAVDPSDHSIAGTHGVRLDDELRLGRIGYPALAWLVSAGQAEAVVWSLVLVNCAAVGLLAGLSAALARRWNRVAIAGLAVAAATGLVMSLSRDLAELMMITAFVAGVLALVGRRYRWAAVAWAGAVLVHEQVIPVIVGYGIARVVAIARRRARFGVEDLPWIAPGVAFVAWQLALRASTGEIPLLGSGSANAAVPFVDMAAAIGGWLTGGLGGQELLAVPQLAVVIVTVVVAVRSRRSLPPDLTWMTYSLAASVLLAASLSRSVWDGPAELRQVVVVPVVAWLVIIASTERIPRSLVAATVTVWSATVLLRLAVI